MADDVKPDIPKPAQRIGLVAPDVFDSENEHVAVSYEGEIVLVVQDWCGFFIDLFAGAQDRWRDVEIYLTEET